MLVKCPWVQHGVFCEKMGYLILEKPRKKKENRDGRNLGVRVRRNIRHKEYESISRRRGRYYRVHHYVYDDNGRRKSKFCYLGNFENALIHLKNVEKILEKYATSEKINEPIYANDFFVWDLTSLKFIKKDINDAENLESFKNYPNRYAEIIYETISSSQFYLIRGEHIFRKYA